MSAGRAKSTEDLGFIVFDDTSDSHFLDVDICAVEGASSAAVPHITGMQTFFVSEARHFHIAAG